MNIPETYDYLVRARRDLWATLQGVPDEVLSLQNPGENMRFRRIYWGLNRSERSKARQILPVERTRTSTAFRPMAPKAIASASSATTAFRRVYTSRWTGREFGPASQSL